MVQSMGPGGVDCSEHFENELTCPHQTVVFDVYRYDAEGRVVRYVDWGDGGGDLDGLALFVGTNHSFALSTESESGRVLKPNSIYFTDGYKSNYGENEEYVGHDIGIYNYRDRTFEPCYYPRDIQSVKSIRPQPIWFTPARE